MEVFERLSHAMGSATDTDGIASWARDEYVVAVDENDNVLGPMSRTLAHSAEGRLHRAFMVLLINKAGHFLLCRRSDMKRLWPGHWADSCAGHPRPGEDIVEAATRRIHDELGCTPKLRHVGHFVYQAGFDGAGSERELCHVLVGRLCSVRPNASEVAEAGLFHWERLGRRVVDYPDDFAPWLVECLRNFPPERLLDAV